VQVGFSALSVELIYSNYFFSSNVKFTTNTFMPVLTFRDCSQVPGLCSVKSRLDFVRSCIHASHKWQEAGLGNNYQSSESMKKTVYPIVFISLIFVGIIVACNFLTAPVQGSKAEVPTSTLSPTETSTPVPTSTSTPTRIPATDTPVHHPTRIPTLTPYSTPQMAPFCDDAEIVNQSSCGYPIAQQSSTFCEKKSPYNLIALNDGATYELLHENIQCKEAGVYDGQRNVICTGPMAYYFELRVCDSACTSLRIESDLERCPFGYAYNNLQNCCTNEIQKVAQGCTVLKLRTISCEIDCGQFTSSSSCLDYGYACKWNYDTDICQLKK